MGEIRAAMRQAGYAELFGGPLDGRLIKDPGTQFLRDAGVIYIRFENVRARAGIIPVTYIYQPVVDNTPLKEHQ